MSWKFPHVSKSLSRSVKTKFGQVMMHWTEVASICRVCKISPICFHGFLCGIFDAVESHHNASESVETFHTSSNHRLEVKKLSLGQWWCTGQRVLEFTYGSNILSLSFMWLNSWKFENWIEIAWNLSQMTEWVVIAERTKFRILSMHFTAFAQSARFHLYGFQGPSLWYLFCGKSSPNHCLKV